MECLSYEELADDVQLGGGQRLLKNPLDDYALVVVNEAHNCRNPDTPTRAATLRRLLAGKRRDLLYPIIDATTVKRTRRLIKKHYASDLIRGPDGRMVPIRFPKPVASSIVYDLDAVLPGFFTRLEEILMKLNRDVAAFLRAHPPADMEQERLDRCLDTVESPWPRRDENPLRRVWEQSFPTAEEKAHRLIEEVESIGAEPFLAPDPLPPIDEEEIRLVTWMALEPERPAKRTRSRPPPHGLDRRAGAS